MADVIVHPHVTKARQRLVTRVILAVGWARAIVIFFTARPPAENPLGYDPMQTKKYLHDLEMYGGTANVLAEEFREWFTSLWQGRNLAYTVAVLTVLLALAVRFIDVMMRRIDLSMDPERPKESS